jgi:hypothetical protein
MHITRVKKRGPFEPRPSLLKNKSFLGPHSLDNGIQHGTEIRNFKSKD